MRRSGWLLPFLALVAWLPAVCWPFMAGAVRLAAAGAGRDATVPVRPLGQLWWTSATWSMAVAVGAVLLGWGPGRLLGRALHRRWFVPLAAAMLAPICLPAYVIFWAWWQAWPPDSSLYRWAVEHDGIVLLRHATLGLGLICWSWPLVAWCVAGWVAAIPAEHKELMRLDGVRPVGRFVDRLRTDCRGLACGAMIVFLTTFNNTTCFDLAEVFTFSNEMRAVQSLGATPGMVLRLGWPAMGMAIMGAIAVWIMIRGRPIAAPARVHGAAGASWLIASTVWLASFAVPMALMIRNVRGVGPAREFGLFYGRALGNTAWIAAACGAIVAMIAAGLALAWLDQRRWVRALAGVQSIGWLITGLLPATAVSALMESAYNRAGLDVRVYQQPVIIVLGHVSAFGMVGALLGRWAAVRQPRDVAELRALDGAATLPGQITTCWPMLLAAGVSAASIAAVLSLSETSLTGQLVPAGFDVLAPAVLNALHYQRPETVALATIGTMSLALVAACAVAMLWPSLGGWTCHKAHPEPRASE